MTECAHDWRADKDLTDKKVKQEMEELGDSFFDIIRPIGAWYKCLVCGEEQLFEGTSPFGNVILSGEKINEEKD